MNQLKKNPFPKKQQILSAQGNIHISSLSVPPFSAIFQTTTEHE